MQSEQDMVGSLRSFRDDCFEVAIESVPGKATSWDQGLVLYCMSSVCHTSNHGVNFGEIEGRGVNRVTW